MLGKEKIVASKYQNVNGGGQDAKAQTYGLEKVLLERHTVMGFSVHWTTSLR